MGFDNVNSSNNNTEGLSVKISFGNEIRRITLPDSSYSTLLDKVTLFFSIERNVVAIKYQDDDGDKISMV